MLTNMSNKTNESLILELTDGDDVGTIGGYCEDGFPIYHANDKIVRMLGYKDIGDLIAGIHGKVANTIHPDDRERVVKELNNGRFYEGMTYKVTYRMLKKDGTPMWTVDKGKVIRAEDGRLAILSICYDMTAFIERHAELEQLNRFPKSILENMPGGYHRCATEEGYPFLYISERFCEILGWTREEIRMEFDNKFINMLHPEDADTTEKYVELLNQKPNENVVDAIYRMKGKNGYIWVSDATTLVTVGNEIFYQGTLTDITNFVVEFKREHESFREQLLIFDTLARHFENVYWVNLEKKTAKILKLDADYVDVPGKEDHQEFSFEVVSKNWINTIVYPEDREKVRSAFTIENIKRGFETREELLGNYRSLVNGKIHYFQYNIIRSSQDGTIAIAGFQNVDDIIEEHQKLEEAKREKEAAHQKEVEEQLAIINALSKSFRNVFVANLREGTARAIRLADGYNVRAIRDVAGQTFQFDAVVDRWVRESVHPDDKKRIKETLNVKNIRQIFSQQDKYVGTYRSIEDGVKHYYQYDFRKIEDTENVVVGFQLIDKIVEEQKQIQKRERALEEARLKEEKEHAEVINSLSTIYSTIFQADISTHEYEILTSVPLMGTVAASKGNFDDVKDTLIETFMEPEFREPLREFLDLNTLSDRFEKVNTVAMDYKAPKGRWMQARFIVKNRDKNGRATETLYVARDITEEKLLKRQAEHDPMTGVFNRGAFDQILMSMEKDKRNFAVIIVDVDNFKNVNDTYGHVVGDEVLKRVSKLLTEGFRSIDHVCRIGGDEFAVVMMDVTSDLGYTIENKIGEINKQLAVHEENVPAVSLSVGVAFMDREHPGESLVKDADRALYYVKEHGRNGCHIYSADDAVLNSYQKFKF